MRHSFCINPKILFVKTSSLGDIIQSFRALAQLKAHFPQAEVDWVVEPAYAPLVAAHPMVRKAISVDFRSWKKRMMSPGAWAHLVREIAALRGRSYDLLFDLQGNTKSGVLSLFAKAQEKVGFGRLSVREWPNLMGTRCRYEVDKKENICLQYASLIERHLSVPRQPVSPFRLLISTSERAFLDSLPYKNAPLRVMVCPGSRWKNKQLEPATLLELLKLIEQRLGGAFLLIWGSEEEKLLCQQLQQGLQQAFVVDQMSLPAWQNLMWEVNLLIGVDSSALHLCSTTPTPTFSFFGPTSAQVYKPEGEKHIAVQGPCPYAVQFDKVCPRLRTCPTGACIRSLNAEELYQISQIMCIWTHAKASKIDGPL